MTLRERKYSSCLAVAWLFVMVLQSFVIYNLKRVCCLSRRARVLQRRSRPIVGRMRHKKAFKARSREVHCALLGIRPSDAPEEDLLT